MCVLHSSFSHPIHCRGSSAQNIGNFENHRIMLCFCTMHFMRASKDLYNSVTLLRALRSWYFGMYDLRLSHFGASGVVQDFLNHTLSEKIGRRAERRRPPITDFLRETGLAVARMPKVLPPKYGWCAGHHKPKKPAQSGYAFLGVRYCKACYRELCPASHAEKQEKRKAACRFCHECKDLVQGLCRPFAGYESIRSASR